MPSSSKTTSTLLLLAVLTGCAKPASDMNVAGYRVVNLCATRCPITLLIGASHDPR